ncbi:hypothetical protein [Oricola thermophila]|uniref:Uncharacterized protein n=1 Tax=Oricola thermophila TaxID=2742145 RepID=A0A6N1VI78_9HYPH|nr:hypothetical protein [Oricola thermophila]QKV19425.1 hypothetical protein HTY61_13630 [Oricola thermophila]
MTKAAFGRRNAKVIASSADAVLKEHAEYRAGAKAEKTAAKNRDGSLIDRMLAWLSYYTLVFVSTVAMTPDTAAAAVMKVRQVVETALPG